MLSEFDRVGGFERDDLPSLHESCELPAAKARRTALGGEEGEGWNCPICPLADRSTRPERLPPCIAEFRDALSTQPRRLPEIEACRLLSGMFNRTCHARDAERPAAARAGVRRISPADVRAHLEHARHLRENEEHMLDDRIWYALRLTEQIERNGLWFKSADRRAKLDRDGFSDWCKAQDALKKMVEVRHRFHDHAPDGGVRKRAGAPRYHYPRAG